MTAKEYLLEHFPGFSDNVAEQIAAVMRSYAARVRVKPSYGQPLVTLEETGMYPTYRQILDLVAAAIGFKPKDLVLRGKNQKVVWGRHMASAIFRELNMRPRDTAAVLGRERTTINNALNTHDELVKSNFDYRQRYEYIREQVFRKTGV